MFCPKCRCEYEEGNATCSECNVALVDQLPPEDEPEFLDWVTVLTTSSEGAAAVAQSVLGSAGILSSVEGIALRDIACYAIASIEVRVRAQDAERAQALLAEHIEMDAESEDTPTEAELAAVAKEPVDVSADEFAAEHGFVRGGESKSEYVDCVTVLAAKDDEEAMVVQSLLGSAGIACYAKGQLIQDLIGGGRIGTGYSVVTGPVEIQVHAEDAEEARRILAESIDTSAGTDSDSDKE